MIKGRKFYEKNWRRLEQNEIPAYGDVWFPGGPCSGWKPRVLKEGEDCLDPVGAQDGAIYRKRNGKKPEFWTPNEKGQT